MYGIFLTFFLIADLAFSVGDSYYDILGVSRTADQKEIRRAFKKLAVLEHPDKNDTPEAHEKFIRLTRAYETLKDPESRKTYDIYGEETLEKSRKKGTYHSWSYYQNNFGLYDDDPWVVTLDENDYFTSVIHSEKMWLVNFYSPMCSHCHHLAPIWRKIARDFEGAARIATLNCEDEWALCRRIGIKAYPTLLYFPKNSEQGEKYTGKKTYDAITNFILNGLDIRIRDIKTSLSSLVSRGVKGASRPTLIFLCGAERNCMSHNERIKVAAIFEDTLDVRVLHCDSTSKCEDTVPLSITALYLPVYFSESWKVVQLEEESNIEMLIEKVLEQLPEPEELDEDSFEMIRRRASLKSDSGWLLCFYIGRATDLSLILKRLPSTIKQVKLGKFNCARYPRTCERLGVNRYPMWGVLKPGGGFELSHGPGNINDIVRFVEASVKARNVRALSAKEVLSLLEGKEETWFLDWYAPWCPPCMNFLREVRRASLEFEESVVRFGTIDCTIHAAVCQRYGIRTYPTAMLINGSDTRKFTFEKTAANIVNFINEARNPSVVRLNLQNFERRLAGRKGKISWVVEFYAPWCGPCQQLAPQWIAVARSLGVLSSAKLGSVDCEAESDLCRAHGIRSYPSIRIYTSDTEGFTAYSTYNGQRDAASILKWVVQFLPHKVRDLNPSSLQSEAFGDRNIWIIDYFVPWCEQCRQLEPEFAIASLLVKNRRISFGRFNCDMYGNECARATIKVYPTLMVYDPRNGVKTITAGFQINGTMAKTIERGIMEFTSRVKRDEL